MADMNFNFDLSGFNKGIDEIQKRIQQLGAALKVATDPKSIKGLTTALQEANNELDSLKSNLASLGTSLSSTMPSIGNAIASSMNLATTSMDAMVNSSAQLVAQLKAAQGMATQPFFQQEINRKQTQAQTDTGPMGGAMFGAGGDMDRTTRSVRDLNESLKGSKSELNSVGRIAVENFNRTTTTIKDAEREIEYYTDKLKEAEDQLKSAKEASAQMGAPVAKHLYEDIDKINKKLEEYRYLLRL